MVISRTASTSKRKKTTDMAESPPKRVTRARAKAAGDAESQLKVTKIVTESVKASAQVKRQDGPAKATKRKTRAGDENGDPGVETIPDEPQRDIKKARTRQKKSKNEMKEHPLKVEFSAPRTRSVVSEKITTEAPKPRGRPKRVASTKIAASTEAKEQEDLEPAGTARSRPVKIGAKRSTAISTAKVPATRKKVNFQVQDEPGKDKENVPLPTKPSEKGVLRATGLKAKPIRKPASTRINTRGKKTEKPTDEEPRPLSPKKVIQIAKSNSVSSEDELGSEKTPVRPLSRSPVKPPVSAIRESERPASRIDSGVMRAPSSPESPVPSNSITSPARRPPPSPFKDALKESPKRAKLWDSLVHERSMAPHSPTKASLMKSPARRLAISMAPPSSTKVSFLQSPARRLVSPIRFNTTYSPPKQSSPVPSVDIATALHQGQSSPCSQHSPEQVISSPPRAPGSTEQSTMAQEIKEIEREAEFKPEISSTPVQSSEKSIPGQEPVDLAADAHLVLDLSPSPARTMGPTPVKRYAPENQIETSGTRNGCSASGTAPQPSVNPAKGFWFAPPSLRCAAEESDSEDELSSGYKSYAPIPVVNQEIPGYPSASALPLARIEELVGYNTAEEDGVIHNGAQWSPITGDGVESFSLTPLAAKLSAWRASSPGKKTPGESSERKRGLFSPAGPTLFDRPEQRQVLAPVEFPPTFSFFEDDIVTRDENGNNSLFLQPEIQERSVEVEESQASEQYGDENVIPLDPQLHATERSADELSLTCTPQRVISSQIREIHTISKVPLRPAAEDSPVDLPRKRGRSLAGPLTEAPRERCDNLFLPAVQDTSLLDEVVPGNPLLGEPATPNNFTCDVPQTPGAGVYSNFGSPLRTARKGAVPNILKGAVVYVDVHTTEGADASGIFLDLLTQMGARCVKQWLWNPRTATGSSADDTGKTSPNSGTPSSKVGITHVVFKDGGKRTLEKVRETKGVVLCVGVGWVLE